MEVYQWKLAEIFQSNMMFQREKEMILWGEAAPETEITAKLVKAGSPSAPEPIHTTKCTADRNGDFRITFPPQEAGWGYRIHIIPGTDVSAEIVLDNICFGDIWLAGGQSNMEFELQNCTEGPDELTNQKDDPNVRFYYTNKIAWKDEHFYEAEKNTCWQTWESDGKKSWSAVGYFFAKKLAQDLGCTVGVIGCNWGGTSASAWMKKDQLAVDDDL